MSSFDQVRQALNDAKEIMRAADVNANEMAEMLKGRLKHVRPYVLAALKKELKDFDAQRKRWKE